MNFKQLTIPRKSLIALSFLVVFVIIAIIFMDIGHSAAIAINDGFENDTVGNWIARGGETLAVTTDQAHSGTQSMKVTGRTKNWEGPQIDLTSQVDNGQKFKLSAWVYLDSDKPGSTKLSANKKDESGESWNTITQNTAPTGKGWFLLEGEYTLEYTGTLEKLTFYIESNFYDESNTEITAEEIEAASYTIYVDDVSIIAEAGTETSSGMPLTYNFDDNSTSGWQARGSSKISASNEQAHSGEYSMLVSDRTQNWEGPETNVTSKVINAQNYYVSAWVYVDSDSDQTIKITANRLDSASDEAWTTVAQNEAVKSRTWTKLEGMYNLNHEGDLEKLVFYFESPATDFNFYIDDVKIDGPVVLNTNFDNGETSGWVAKGNPIVGVSTDVVHAGTHSLLTSGRTDTWQGPEYDLSGKLVKGTKYNFSLWVYQASEAEQNIKLTVFSNDSENGDTYTTVASNGAVPSGVWTLLEGSYTYTYDGEAGKCSMYVEAPDNIEFDFYIDDVIMTGSINKIQIQDIPSLYEKYKDDFYLGVAIPASVLDDSTKSELVTKHFNSITAENEMKIDAIHPSEDTYNFAVADKFVKFAKDNGIRLRYHTLVWHSQVPDWFFVDSEGKDVTKDVLLARMKTHIETIVNKYGADMESWDVLNEAIDDSTGGLRQSKWQQIIGDDYVEYAFKYAREAAEAKGYNIKLVYNDYNLENEGKLNAACDLVTNLKSKGLIDAVGTQSHISIDSDLAKYEASIAKLCSLGVDVEVTELDMKVNPSGAYTVIPESVLIKQAYKYKAIFDIYEKYKDVISSVTIWGLTDDMSWLNYFEEDKVEGPLFFDKNCQAKYSYWALVDPTKIPLEILEAKTFKGKPEIDGSSADKVWKYAIPTNIIDSSNNQVGNFKTLWEDKNLYASVEVDKAQLSNLKSVDFYVDQDNSKDKTIQDGDLHYSISASGETSDDMEGKVKETDSGYVIEVAMPIEMVNSQKGTNIGFDVKLTKSDDSMISWNDTTNSQEDPSKYGVLIFTDPKLTTAEKGTVTVDAEIDSIWSTAKSETTDIITQGTEPAKATYKTLWDSEYIYVLADVKDPLLSDASTNAWEQDSIEIFVDENFHRSVSYEADDGQYRINFNNVASFGENGQNDKFKSATKLTDGGYLVEVAIPITTITTQPEMLLGFDLQVNDDSTGEGTRTGMSNWSDESTQGYKNTSNFGILELVATSQTEPSVEPSTEPSTEPTPTVSEEASPTPTTSEEVSPTPTESQTITPSTTPSASPTVSPTQKPSNPVTKVINAIKNILKKLFKWF